MARFFFLLALSMLLLIKPLQIKAGPVVFVDTMQQVYDLKAGEAVEISVRINEPSKLPANGRIAVNGNHPKECPLQPTGAKFFMRLMAMFIRLTEHLFLASTRFGLHPWLTKTL